MHGAKRNQRLGAMVGAALLGLAGCATDRGPHPNLPPIGIASEFTSRNLCSLGVSPEVRLGGVPAGTATYRWQMTNVSVVRGTRWQGFVPAEGPVIAEGAVADFPTPCPGDQQNMVYRFEIMALDASGRPLGYGWSFVSAISTTRRIELEQAQAKGRLPAHQRTLPGPTLPAFFTY